MKNTIQKLYFSIHFYHPSLRLFCPSNLPPRLFRLLNSPLLLDTAVLVTMAANAPSFSLCHVSLLISLHEHNLPTHIAFSGDVVGGLSLRSWVLLGPAGGWGGQPTCDQNSNTGMLGSIWAHHCLCVFNMRCQSIHFFINNFYFATWQSVCCCFDTLKMLLKKNCCNNYKGNGFHFGNLLLWAQKRVPLSAFKHTFPLGNISGCANMKRLEQQTWLECSHVVPLPREADVSSHRWNEHTERQKGETGKIGEAGMWSCEGLVNADSPSTMKATNPCCCHGNLLSLSFSLPSFQHATTYPCCLSVSRAGGCVRRFLLALEWIKQMKRRAVGKWRLQFYFHLVSLLLLFSHLFNPFECLYIN